MASKHSRWPKIDEFYLMDFTHMKHLFSESYNPSKLNRLYIENTSGYPKKWKKKTASGREKSNVFFSGKKTTIAALTVLFLISDVKVNQNSVILTKRQRDHCNQPRTRERERTV